MGHADVHALEGPAHFGPRMVVSATLLVLLVAALGATSVWHAWQDAHSRAEARATNLALLVAANLSSLLARAGVAIGETASQLERDLARAGEFDRSTLWPLVDAGTQLVPEVARLGVFDEQGHQVCGEPRARCLQLKLADRDYFRDLAARNDSQPQLYGPYTSLIDGESILILARALRSRDQRFAGAVMALIPVQRLAEQLAAADTVENGLVHLRRADLSLVVGVPPAAADRSTEPSDALRRAVEKDPEHGSFRARSPIDGIDRQAAYRRLTGYSPYVVVGLSTQAFLAPWREQLLGVSGLLLLVTLSVGLILRLSWRVARGQRRIRALYDGAPCGYHSIDARGRYKYINATELSWLGCTLEEVVGRCGPVDFFTAESVASFRQHFPDLVMKHDRVEGLEFDLCGRQGERRRVLVNAVAVRDATGRFMMSNSVMLDISELHRARLALQQAADELEARVDARTQELRTAAAALDAAETRERRQLARDLHDDLGQTLAAASIHLGLLQTSTDPATRQTAAKVAAMIDRANRATRSLATQLAPAMLDELGLPDTLEWLAEEIERTYGLHVGVADDGLPKPLSPEARSILYRATRELLVNAAKHARAEAAEVELERQGDRIVVRVRDGGVGFDASVLRPSAESGLGLLSVRERMAFIGGKVELRSRPGDGAEVTLSAPLAAEAGALKEDGAA